VCVAEQATDKDNKVSRAKNSLLNELLKAGMTKEEIYLKTGVGSVRGK
jgi:hypothetical protein